MTAFAQLLGEKAERYIELRHFPRLRLQQASVGRAQLDAPATRTMALDFVLSFSGGANSLAIRHGVLRRFYEYLAVYEARTDGLECRAFPRSRAIPPPRVLSEAELTSLIEAAPAFRLASRGRTLATLIGWLASSGLRSGEVVGLDRSDVDLTNGVLLIRETKFRKDRLVPVHTTTQGALGCYARERDAAFPIPRIRPFSSVPGATASRRPACKTALPRTVNSPTLMAVSR